MAIKSNRKFVLDPLEFPKKARELGYDPSNMTEEQVIEVLKHIDPKFSMCKVTKPNEK